MPPISAPRPGDRARLPALLRLSGAPDLPRGDRRVVPLAGGRIQVEAFPWSGGLSLWTQDQHGRWVQLSLRT